MGGLLVTLKEKLIFEITTIENIRMDTSNDCFGFSLSTRSLHLGGGAYREPLKGLCNRKPPKLILF